MSDCEKREDFDRERDCVRCPDPGHPLPKPILFECGNGGGFTFAANCSNSTEDNACCICTPKTVANVTIDTSCLCKPKIKVEFSSIIHFIPDSDGKAQLEFDLVRCCKDFPECVVGTWNYEIEENDKFAKSFCFDYCDCSTCPGLHLYRKMQTCFCKGRRYLCHQLSNRYFSQGH